MSQAFQKLLQAVVFGNGRNGALRVELGQYVLRSARSGQVVEAGSWQNLVKAGAHISQAIVVSDQDIKLQRCEIPGCSGVISVKGESWYDLVVGLFIYAKLIIEHIVQFVASRYLSIQTLRNMMRQLLIVNEVIESLTYLATPHLSSNPRSRTRFRRKLVPTLHLDL